MAVATSDPLRPGTIAALESAAEGRGSWLRAALSSANGAVPRVGEKITFEFLSDRDAYLTALHVDGEGNVTILIEEFYTQLKDPSISKARALQLAQVKLLENPKFEHPRYWSPYLIISNWL